MKQYTLLLFIACLGLHSYCFAKKSWEFGRFLKTASYYNALLPKLPFTSRLSSSRIVLNPGNALWSTTSNGNGVQWGPLDDVVMGGVSKSDLEPGQAFDGMWTGLVTSENNGGFAGIRTKLFTKPFDVTASQGFLLRIRGDGQRYKFIVRDDDEWNGVAWAFSFDTVKSSNNGKLQEVKVPFGSLKPTKYARILEQGPSKIDTSRIAALQFSLSKFEYNGGLNPKFQEGPFSLYIEEVKTY